MLQRRKPLTEGCIMMLKEEGIGKILKTAGIICLINPCTVIPISNLPLRNKHFLKNIFDELFKIGKSLSNFKDIYSRYKFHLLDADQKNGFPCHAFGDYYFFK